MASSCLWRHSIIAKLFQSRESNPYIILWDHKTILIFACLGIQLSILEILTIETKYILAGNSDANIWLSLLASSSNNRNRKKCNCQSSNPCWKSWLTAQWPCIHSTTCGGAAGMNCNSCRKPFHLHAPNCKKTFNSGILLAESKMPEKILSISDLEVAGSKKLPTPARGEQAFSAPIRL